MKSPKGRSIGILFLIPVERIFFVEFINKLVPFFVFLYLGGVVNQYLKKGLFPLLRSRLEIIGVFT